MISSPYLKEPLSGQQLSGLVERAVKLLEKNNAQFDSIAVRGVSGLLFGPALAARMGKNIIVVRKDAEMSPHGHSGCRVEGDIETKAYIVADDLICSGDTIREVIKQIYAWQSKYKKGRIIGECVGVLCYKDGMGQYNVDKFEDVPIYSISTKCSESDAMFLPEALTARPEDKLLASMREFTEILDAITDRSEEQEDERTDEEKVVINLEYAEQIAESVGQGIPFEPYATCTTLSEQEIFEVQKRVDVVRYAMYGDKSYDPIIKQGFTYYDPDEEYRRLQALSCKLAKIGG
jgi:orotate phosphoribosyltransferase